MKNTLVAPLLMRQGFNLSYPIPVEKVEKLFQQIQARDDSKENTFH